MMRPDADTDSFRDMREMADRITKMTAVLGDVVERFVRGLARSDATETLTEGIEAIRDLESECDDLRNDAIETAFFRTPTSTSRSSTESSRSCWTNWRTRSRTSPIGSS